MRRLYEILSRVGGIAALCVAGCSGASGTMPRTPAQSQTAGSSTTSAVRAQAPAIAYQPLLSPAAWPARQRSNLRQAAISGAHPSALSDCTLLTDPYYGKLYARYVGSAPSVIDDEDCDVAVYFGPNQKGGSLNNSTIVNSYIAILISTTSNVSIRNVNVYPGSAAGIVLADEQNATVDRFSSSNSIYYGILLENSTASITNTSLSNEPDGIYANGPNTTVNVGSSVFQGGETGVYSGGLATANIRNSLFKQNSDFGVDSFFGSSLSVRLSKAEGSHYGFFLCQTPAVDFQANVALLNTFGYWAFNSPPFTSALWFQNLQNFGLWNGVNAWAAVGSGNSNCSLDR